MDTLPPARAGAENKLPDFYLNSLIFEDSLSQDSCKWVVFDGLTRVRFPTRAAAIAWIENHKTILPAARSRLQRIANRVNAAWISLDNEAFEMPDLERTILERIALALRQTNESLENFIKNYIKEQ